jgi:hypothetical protein
MKVKTIKIEPVTGLYPEPPLSSPYYPTLIYLRSILITDTNSVTKKIYLYCDIVYEFNINQKNDFRMLEKNTIQSLTCV